MPFEKGKSGNPGGRSRVRTKDGRTLGELARDHTEHALQCLIDIMQDSETPAAARVSAANHILDRGWGRAPQSVSIDEPEQALDLSSLSDEQLAVLQSLKSLDGLIDRS